MGREDKQVESEHVKADGIRRDARPISGLMQIAENLFVAALDWDEEHPVALRVAYRLARIVTEAALRPETNLDPKRLAAWLERFTVKLRATDRLRAAFRRTSEAHQSEQDELQRYVSELEQELAIFLASLTTGRAPDDQGGSMAAD